MKEILQEIDRNYKNFYEKLDMSLNYLVNTYYDYFDSDKKERIFVLNHFAEDLEKISKIYLIIMDILIILQMLKMFLKEILKL